MKHYQKSSLRLFMSFQLLGKQYSGYICHIYRKSICQLHKKNHYITFCLLVTLGRLIYEEINFRGFAKQTQNQRKLIYAKTNLRKYYIPGILFLEKCQQN